MLAAEAQGEQLAKELEEQCRRHEQDLLTLNLQVSSPARLEVIAFMGIAVVCVRKSINECCCGMFVF